MAYRGGDLDLRTPRTWSAGQTEPSSGLGEASRSRGGYQPGPIWVDDAILACVNHAFDVAVAHRSAEVRLEHLLHALTRIEPAAEALEQRGVRVASLRRDTATAIASEIPVSVQNGNATPLTSGELEHVLRVSSVMAARRNQPANVDDLVHLILDVEPDLPGLALLARSRGRGHAISDAPAYSRAGYLPSEPRYVETSEVPRERTRRDPPLYYGDAGPRVSREGYGGTAIDTIQNSRLDALEQMVRALSADLATERNTFGDMLQELQRDVSEHRMDTVRLGNSIADRISGVLTDRVDDRIASTERSVAVQLERLTETLRNIEAEARQRIGVPANLEPIDKRLELIEEAVLSGEGEKAVAEIMTQIAALGERMDGLLAGERTRAGEVEAALRSEIGALTDAIRQHHGEIATAEGMRLLIGRLAASEREIAEIASKTQHIVGDYALRSETLAAEFAAKSEGQLGSYVQKAEALYSDYQARTAEMQSASRDDLRELHDAVMKLNDNQHALVSLIEQSRAEVRQVLEAVVGEVRSVGPQVAAYSERISAIEGEAMRVATLVEAVSGSVDRMHRVTVERYYRRHRFWYWLFGTDDWVASSWPSQAQRIADEFKAVRGPQSRG